MPTDMTIANTIREQLGRGFEVMVGARNFVGYSKSLHFKILAAGRSRYISIALDASDTYTVTYFTSTIKGGCKVIETASDIYAENLLDCIGRMTGLAVTMPRVYRVTR